jgi:hypothetical protein
MLSWDDDHCNHLTGGYKTLFDSYPLLAKLEIALDLTKEWQQLWGELYHQGDIGDACYAAVPLNRPDLPKARDN